MEASRNNLKKRKPKYHLHFGIMYDVQLDKNLNRLKSSKAYIGPFLL